MQDLYKSKLKLGVEDTPYNRYYFSTVTDPFERKVYTEKLAPPGKKENFLTASEGVQRVRAGLFAFIAEETGMYKLMEDTYYEHEKCGLVSWPSSGCLEWFQNIDCRLASSSWNSLIPSWPSRNDLHSRKSSKLSKLCKFFSHETDCPLLDSSLIKVMEVGVQRRTMSKIYTKRPICVNRQNFQSISIDDALPALLVVPFGIAFSLATLLVEKISRMMNFSRKLCLKV